MTATTETPNVTTLDEYLHRYGPLLGKQAEEALNPLHVPGRDPLPDFSGFWRTPYEPQQHVIAATIKALDQNNSVLPCCEMGTGKTIMAMASVHLHAGGQGYRALVFCPGQLVEKWGREITETIPHARITNIENWTTLRHLPKGRPTHPEWYIISRDRAKLGAEWRAAATSFKYTKTGYHCPKCGQRIVDKDGNSVTLEHLGKKMTRCENVVTTYKRVVPESGEPYAKEVSCVCDAELFAYVGKQQGGLDRWEPARYIHKKMRHYFRYLVIDEAHEEKSADSAQGIAAGALMASCRYVLAMTGTLIGGYANHVRPLLFRLAPRTLIEEGLSWNNPGVFDKRYGKIERVVTETQGESTTSNRQSRGGSGRRVSESVKPGIVPTLFGRHLLGNTVYLSLSEMSDKLPKLRPIILPVAMNKEQQAGYDEAERRLKEANKILLLRGNKALLGTMLQTLLTYPDYPFDWPLIGYYEKDRKPSGEVEKRFVPVVKPKSLPDNKVYPKEQQLIDVVRAEAAEGRQCWVYVQNTGERDVQARLVKLLNEAGVKTGQLRADTPLAKRERWIAEKGAGFQCVVSHPKLVETGLDLFDKNGGHNFCTLIYYQTGYNLFTLRQSSRRAWRIGQKLECRVYYLFYEGSMQSRAMALMGRKLSAAQAIEGEFSSEGLVAMGGDDVSMEMALATSLNSVLSDDTARVWASISEVASGPVSGATLAAGGDGGTFESILADMNTILAGFGDTEENGFDLGRDDFDAILADLDDVDALLGS